DGVIDAVARALRAMPAADAAAMTPRHVSVLLQVFPVLGRIERFAHAPRPRMPLVDPVDLRTRALSALRELFARLAERRPLVIAMDDVQWADVDSRELLHVLIEPPEPPPLMIVVTSRQTSPEFLADVREVTDVELGALDASAAYSLADSLLAKTDGV